MSNICTRGYSFKIPDKNLYIFNFNRSNTTITNYKRPQKFLNPQLQLLGDSYKEQDEQL